MKCDVSEEKWVLHRFKSLVSIKRFTWNIITMMGIQDKNTKNSMKSKNYHKSKALKEFEKLYMDWLVYCYKVKCTVYWDGREYQKRCLWAQIKISLHNKHFNLVRLKALSTGQEQNLFRSR